ncbi:15716_t:CDS:2, partial [Gigaspora rosea]
TLAIKPIDRNIMDMGTLLQVIFEPNFHGELIIDYELVEVANNERRTRSRKDGGRPWSPLTLNELKIWLGLIIYMGVHKISAVEDLWNNDEKNII